MNTTQSKTTLALCAVIAPLLLSACSQSTHSMSVSGLADSIKQPVAGAVDAITPDFVRSSHSYSAKEKECLARAMFFESHRSSRDGMIAVGTVVMNRKRSGQYPDTICGVVGQKRQFAPGVLTRPMNSKALPDVMEAADAVLKGERHPKLKNAMHFHTAGLKFKYNNMHYVAVAGGNSFYEKRSRNWKPLPPEGGGILSSIMVASAEPEETQRPAETVRVAAAEPREAPQTFALASLPAEAPAFPPRPTAAKSLPKPASQQREAVAYVEPASDRFGASEPAFSYDEASGNGILILPPPDEARFGD